jgi:L-asparaginase II
LEIAITISDGDRANRARTTAAVAVLSQLGALDAGQIGALKDFTTRLVLNGRNLEVGEIRPVFKMK